MMLRCLSKQKETHDVITYTLERQGMSLEQAPALLAGQYATVDLKGLGPGGKVLTRTWTISCSPAHTAQHNTITLSIKNVSAHWQLLSHQLICCLAFESRSNFCTNKKKG